MGELSGIGMGLAIIAFTRVYREKLRRQSDKYGYDEKYISSFKMTIPFEEREFFPVFDNMSEFDEYIRASKYRQSFFNGIPVRNEEEECNDYNSETMADIDLDFERIGLGIDLSKLSVPSICESDFRKGEVTPGWRI